MPNKMFRHTHIAVKNNQQEELDKLLNKIDDTKPSLLVFYLIVGALVLLGFLLYYLKKMKIISIII
jgi:hypothetical protein